MPVPEDFADRMVASAPAFWRDQPEDVQAADMELCYPLPGPGEVRVAVSEPVGLRRCGISVVTSDRPGLLAASAAVIARHDLTIGMAVASSWHGLGLALQRFQVCPTGARGRRIDASALSADLRRTLVADASAGRTSPEVGEGIGRLRLGCEPLGDDRHLVTLFAPDGPGLLAAVCRGLQRESCDIELASIASANGIAEDLLVVRGEPDLGRLGTALVEPGGDLRILPPGPLTAGSAQLAMRRLLARSLASGSPRSRELAHRLAHRRRTAHSSR